MGVPMWLIYIYCAGFFFLAIVVGILKLFRNSVCIRLATKARNLLEAKLIWNGSIRLFMEIYLDLALSAFLNVYTADWDSSSHAVDYSNIIAIIALALTAVAPFLLVWHYSRNWDHVYEPEFRKKYGTFVDDLKIDKFEDLKWELLIVPTFFIIRRVAFLVTVFFLKKYLWLQLLVQTVSSAILFSIYWNYKPLDSPYSLKMESFNELTVILLNTLMVCFTDYVPKSEDRS